MQVELDHYSLRIDGVRRLVRAAELHYFRLPSPELWRDRLERMRDIGLNAVSVPYPWSYHSGAPGEYDFTGFRDVDRLHDLIEEAGLWLIAQPGPWIGADLDLGGLPAWLVRDEALIPRCRAEAGFIYSQPFMRQTRDWFQQIVARFASRSNLLLVQIESGYTLPTPLTWARTDWADLWVRRFGSGRVSRVLGSRRRNRALRDRARRDLAAGRARGQTSPYMRELYDLVREFGVAVPILHDDRSSVVGRQVDVDLPSVSKAPLVPPPRGGAPDSPLDRFALDEAGLDAHNDRAPVFYAKLPAGWSDFWGGPGFERIRERLSADPVDSLTKAALSERAAGWSYSGFCGGTTWGYLGAPNVYSSYDCGGPIAESGRVRPEAESVRRLNEFLDRFEDDLCESRRVESRAPWAPGHSRTRQGPVRRFEFLENRLPRSAVVATPESERAELFAGELQIRVYGKDRQLEGVSPAPLESRPPGAAPAPVLPDLERWSFSGVSPQIDPGYDDSSWSEIPGTAIERGKIDVDSLGTHYGFIWYRGTFQGRLDRLLLDARHCWAAWLNRELVAKGDQFQNTLGIGGDGARRVRVPLPSTREEGRNVLTILVESLGHNQGLCDDGANPRGLVQIDTGATRIQWRFRGGLVRGEHGIAPVVAFEGVERTNEEELVLPHSWGGEPVGIGLYETRFALEGVDPKQVSLGLRFDPGRGKANLYLNGFLLGRYWPERGPQRTFPLPWGVLHPDRENHLAIAVWKRDARAALGKVRVEVLD